MRAGAAGGLPKQCCLGYAGLTLESPLWWLFPRFSDPEPLCRLAEGILFYFVPFLVHGLSNPPLALFTKMARYSPDPSSTLTGTQITLLCRC